MKRLNGLLLVLTLAVTCAAPALAARARVVHRGPRHRTVVVVHRGWPLHRPLRPVYIHPARSVVRVHTGVFLAPVIWAPRVIAVRPARDYRVWEDGETLVREDDWSEFTLNADSQGRQLDLEVTNGRVQLDWAEVVFENGDTQVVDFNERTVGPGNYSLLDFRDGRRVDHVRMVARAKSSEARVVLVMEK